MIFVGLEAHSSAQSLNTTIIVHKLIRYVFFRIAVDGDISTRFLSNLAQKTSSFNPNSPIILWLIKTFTPNRS